MKNKNMKSSVTLFIFAFFVIGACLGATVSVKSEIVNMTILEEGFESGIPTGWNNNGWLDSWYGSSHNGTGWAYSWAEGDTLTTTTLNFGNNTNLSFWHASEIGSPMSLEVYIDDTNTSNLLWSYYNFTYKEYNKILIDLSNYNGYHQIIFVSKTSGLNGQLLDDIVITSYLEEDDLPPVENTPPVADLSKGEPYQGYTNGSILFDASLSYDPDPDGSIVKWNWDLGDGTQKKGETVYHNYETAGTYNVTLQVVDNNDGTATDTTIVQIQYGNYPPSQPLVKNREALPQYGYIYVIMNKNNEASFLISSYDNDGDSIRFSIDWGDEINETTEYIDSDSKIDVNHSWDTAGWYNVSFIAEDGQNASSEPVQIIIFLNIGVKLFTSDITGYLIDYSNVGNYSHFYNVELGLKTNVSMNDNEQYLIDADRDGEWDYTYNETSGLTVYQSEKTSTPDTPGFEFLILSFSILLFIFINRKRK
jgi:hypothetical protein